MKDMFASSWSCCSEASSSIRSSRTISSPSMRQGRLPRQSWTLFPIVIALALFTVTSSRKICSCILKTRASPLSKLQTLASLAVWTWTNLRAPHVARRATSLPKSSCSNHTAWSAITGASVLWHTFFFPAHRPFTTRTTSNCLSRSRTVSTISTTIHGTTYPKRQRISCPRFW